MRYIAYLSTLDDSNYSSKEFDGIINSSKVKKLLLDGSEATIFPYVEWPI